MIPCVNNLSPLTLSGNDYTLGTGRIRGAQTIDVDLIRGIGQYQYLINADSPNLPTADDYIINNIVFTEAGEMLQYATPVMKNGVYSVRFYEENSNDFTDWQPVVSDSHTHPNKTVLDGITATNVTNWNNKLDIEDLNGFVYDVSYNSTNHQIIIFQKNEPNIVIDLPIEQLIKGVQLVGNDLIFTFEDGSTVTVPLNTLLVGVVKSVNGLTPNSQGEIILNVTDIPNLSSELANKLDIRMAGLVSNLTQPEKDAILTKLGVVNNIVQVLGLSGNTITLSNGGGSISLNIANIGGLQNALDAKVGNFENVTGIGFANGNFNDAPYFYHPTGGFKFLATQEWANNNFVSNTALGNYVNKAGDTMSGVLNFTGSNGLNLNNGQWGVKYDSAYGGINFVRYDFTDGVFFIKDNENIGIGTTNPQAKLHVNGNAIVADATQPNHAVNLGQLNLRADTRLSNVVNDLSEIEKTSIKNKLGITDVTNAVLKDVPNEITDDFSLVNGDNTFYFYDNSFSFNYNDNAVGLDSDGLELNNNGIITRFSTNKIQFNKVELKAFPNKDSNLMLPIVGLTQRALSVGTIVNGETYYADQDGLVDLGNISGGNEQVEVYDLFITPEFQQILDYFSCTLDFAVAIKQGKTLTISFTITKPDTEPLTLIDGVLTSLFGLPLAISNNLNMQIVPYLRELKMFSTDHRFEQESFSMYLDLSTNMIVQPETLILGELKTNFYNQFKILE